MTEKNLKIDKKDIAPVALGRGGCIATDRILVDGCLVGYMYREPPSNMLDSGWRFFSGDESDEYMADENHHGIYDVNTIVNYDPSILKFLDAEIGAEYERADDGTFVSLAV